MIKGNVDRTLLSNLHRCRAGTSPMSKLACGRVQNMEFELWLFAIKQLAQSYEMSQVIYSQLTDAEKEDLHREYDATVGGGSSGGNAGKADEKSRKTLKEYRDLINSFHNAMSIAERFVEKNTVKNLDRDYPVDPSDADPEFLRRIFINMETETRKVIRYLNYTAKDVATEGELKKGNDGRYYIGDLPISEGRLLEFFYRDRWEIGILCRNPESVYGYFFLGFQNEIYDVDLEGLKIRVRE